MTNVWGRLIWKCLTESVDPLTHANTHICSHQHFYQLFMASDQISCISLPLGESDWVFHSTVLINLLSNVATSHTHTLDELGFTVASPSFKNLGSVCHRFTAVFLAQLSCTWVSCERWNEEQDLRWTRRKVLCKIHAYIKMQTPACSCMHLIM